MARFKYKGPKPRPQVKIPGKTKEMRFHCKDGTTLRLFPKPPNKFFAPNQDIGYDITDSRVIRHLEADPKFQRIS